MERVAIWLCPAEPAASALRATIAAIAARWSRVAYEPHVTLASGPRRADVTDVLRVIAARHAPYPMTPRAAHAGDDFKTSAALDFTTTDAHARLRADVRAAFGWDERPREPHMSLTYGAVSDFAPIQASAARFTAPVVFDALRAVLYEAPVDSQEKVAAWVLGPRVPLTA